MKLKKEIVKNKVSFIHDHLPTLYVHKTGVTQLFYHLIQNAIKFRSQTPPIIQISYQQNKNSYTFKVSDNGIGMSENYQNKIFSPFQKLDHNKTNGIGIGLAICKKVLTRLGGNIRLESEEGKGSTFYCSLPNYNGTVTKLEPTGELVTNHE